MLIINSDLRLSGTVERVNGSDRFCPTLWMSGWVWMDGSILIELHKSNHHMIYHIFFMDKEWEWECDLHKMTHSHPSIHSHTRLFIHSIPSWAGLEGRSAVLLMNSHSPRDYWDTEDLVIGGYNSARPSYIYKSTFAWRNPSAAIEPVSTHLITKMDDHYYDHHNSLDCTTESGRRLKPTLKFRTVLHLQNKIITTFLSRAPSAGLAPGC